MFHIMIFPVSLGSCILDGLILMEGGKTMCTICGLKLSKLSNGKAHIRDVHGSKEKVMCPICKKFYKNERTRNAHAKDAHGLNGQQIRSFNENANFI